jgi:hypothetical protein
MVDRPTGALPGAPWPMTTKAEVGTIASRSHWREAPESATDQAREPPHVWREWLPSPTVGGKSKHDNRAEDRVQHMFAGHGLQAGFLSHTRSGIRAGGTGSKRIPKASRRQCHQSTPQEAQVAKLVANG